MTGEPDTENRQPIRDTASASASPRGFGIASASLRLRGFDLTHRRHTFGTPDRDTDRATPSATASGRHEPRHRFATTSAPTPAATASPVPTPQHQPTPTPTNRRRRHQHHTSDTSRANQHKPTNHRGQLRRSTIGASGHTSPPIGPQPRGHRPTQTSTPSTSTHTEPEHDRQA